MKLSNIEKEFLDQLESVVDMKFSVGRDEHGVFTVHVDSPCENVGYLKAHVRNSDITLSCKISHTHSELSRFTRLDELDPVKAMIMDAVKSFDDFVHDRSYVSQTLTEDGVSVCSGWGPIELAGDSDNKKFWEMLQEQYKSPIRTEYWVWSGKYEEL